jgi:hypothetical protein
MTIDEAVSILCERRYNIHRLPSLPDGTWWMATDPGSDDYDEISETDVMQFAEALRDQRRCYYCREQAVSQCPICHRWTCYEDRRDFPPDFDAHWCPDCIGKHNAIMRSGLVEKTEITEVRQ